MEIAIFFSLLYLVIFRPIKIHGSQWYYVCVCFFTLNDGSDVIERFTIRSSSIHVYIFVYIRSIENCHESIWLKLIHLQNGWLLSFFVVVVVELCFYFIYSELSDWMFVGWHSKKKWSENDRQQIFVRNTIWYDSISAQCQIFATEWDERNSELVIHGTEIVICQLAHLQLNMR